MEPQGMKDIRQVHSLEASLRSGTALLLGEKARLLGRKAPLRVKKAWMPVQTLPTLSPPLASSGAARRIPSTWRRRTQTMGLRFSWPVAFAVPSVPSQVLAVWGMVRIGKEGRASSNYYTWGSARCISAFCLQDSGQYRIYSTD